MQREGGLMILRRQYMSTKNVMMSLGRLSFDVIYGRPLSVVKNEPWLGVEVICATGGVGRGPGKVDDVNGGADLDAGGALEPPVVAARWLSWRLAKAFNRFSSIRNLCSSVKAIFQLINLKDH